LNPIDVLLIKYVMPILQETTSIIVSRSTIVSILKILSPGENIHRVQSKWAFRAMVSLWAFRCFLEYINKALTAKVFHSNG